MSAAKLSEEALVVGRLAYVLRAERVAFSRYQSAKTVEDLEKARNEWISELIAVTGPAMSLLPAELRHELEMLGMKRD